MASPTRPAPADSPRVGTQQGYVVERCDVGRLPFLIFLFGGFFFAAISRFSVQSFVQKRFFSKSKTNFLWSFFLSKKKIRFHPKGFPIQSGLRHRLNQQLYLNLKICIFTNITRNKIRNNVHK